MQRGTRDEWRERVARWRRSGETAGAFTTREGVEEATLRWWAWKLRATRAKREPAASMVPLRVQVTPRSVEAAQLDLDMDGATLRFTSGTDVEYVAVIVHALAVDRRFDVVAGGRSDVV